MGVIRIIGGRWRSRLLRFPDRSALRPTPNRVREMVFNWLTPYLPGSICLDAFAGSGALGFEALSRGAQKAVMLERHRPTVEQLVNNAKSLKTESAVIIQGAFPEAIPSSLLFDIVFMDPPFQDQRMTSFFNVLIERQCLASGALIYCETSADSTLALLPSSWVLLKQKTSGAVCSYLVQAGRV